MSAVPVKDVTDATFQADVVDRSRQIPVVVDLWAPWCGPCKTLGPIIEQVVADAGGTVELAKINVDENPGASQAFQVQSIPAVYALKDGKVVDGFIGAKGQAEVAEFVAKLAPSQAAQELDSLVAAGDEASLRRALELEPAHEPAIVGLAGVLVESDRGEEALDLLAKVPETPETRHLAAVARLGSEGSGADEVTSRLDALLEAVKGDDDARREFIDLLEVLGPDDPRTREYRKQLTARLY